MGRKEKEREKAHTTTDSTKGPNKNDAQHKHSLAAVAVVTKIKRTNGGTAVRKISQMSGPSDHSPLPLVATDQKEVQAS